MNMTFIKYFYPRQGLEAGLCIAAAILRIIFGSTSTSDQMKISKNLHTLEKQYFYQYLHMLHYINKRVKNLSLSSSCLIGPLREAYNSVLVVE